VAGRPKSESEIGADRGQTDVRVESVRYRAIGSPAGRRVARDYGVMQPAVALSMATQPVRPICGRNEPAAANRGPSPALSGRMRAADPRLCNSRLQYALIQLDGSAGRRDAGDAGYRRRRTDERPALGRASDGETRALLGRLQAGAAAARADERLRLDAVLADRERLEVRLVAAVGADTVHPRRLRVEAAHRHLAADRTGAGHAGPRNGRWVVVRIGARARERGQARLEGASGAV